jgi:hypothetical protein
MPKFKLVYRRDYSVAAGFTDYAVEANDAEKAKKLLEEYVHDLTLAVLTVGEKTEDGKIECLQEETLMPAVCSGDEVMIGEFVPLPRKDRTVQDAKAIEAIRKLADYLESDERRHFEECGPDNKADHIYNDVVTVREWLSRQ